MKKMIKYGLCLLIAVFLMLQAVVVYAADAPTQDSTDQSAALGSLFAADDRAGAEAIVNYTHWLCENYSSGLCTRAQWLYDLMDRLNLTDGAEIGDILRAAQDRGIIDDVDTKEMYLPLTRIYVAHTLVRAMDYAPCYPGYVSDTGDDDMLTMVYYGYFFIDEEDRCFPDACVTAEEYTSLMTELDRCRRLRGLTLMSFGDSIMYGKGNDGEGIADMIAGKYGMYSIDYAVNGATMGVFETRSHIPTQIANAHRAGETADLILIDGGTNDMLHVPIGTISAGFSVGKDSEYDYTGGFERSLTLINQYWSGVPVIYVRAHDMKIGHDIAEQEYGERAVTICEKWGIPYIDLYRDSDFNAEDDDIRIRYTYLNPKNETYDSIHPTALGYAEYYLPPISQAVAKELSYEVQDD